MRSINSSVPSSVTSKQKLLVGSALLLAAIAGTLFYTETHHLTNFIRNPFYKPTATDMTAQQKEQATKSDPTTTNSNKAKASSQPAAGVSNSQTTDQVPTSTTATVNITSLSQSNGTVNITTTIANPATSGTCTITYTKSGAKPVTRTISTTSNTCSSSIPELEFSMTGDWQVDVHYFANNTQAATKGTITIK